jgi:cytochrome b561
MKIMTLAMTYLRERQTAPIRYLHITIIILVLSQIVVSNFMDFNDAGEISTDGIEFYATWLHIITGLFIIPLGLFLTGAVLIQHGFSNFFPYLGGDLSQVKADIAQLMKRELPEALPNGLAAVVQGLGLAALLLVLSSGLIWFLSWNAHLPWADAIKEVHEFSTGFLLAYIVGHGAMGALHIFLLSRSHSDR